MNSAIFRNSEETEGVIPVSATVQHPSMNQQPINFLNQINNNGSLNIQQSQQLSFYHQKVQFENQMRQNYHHHALYQSPPRTIHQHNSYEPTPMFEPTPHVYYNNNFQPYPCPRFKTENKSFMNPNAPAFYNTNNNNIFSTNYQNNNNNNINYNSNRQLTNQPQEYNQLQQNQSEQNFVDLTKILPADYVTEKKLFSNETANINFEHYNDIPVDVVGTEIPQALNTFEDGNFHEIILNTLKLSQYDKPTPVQKYAIPIILAKRDLMACAQTGSGKTAAFLMPIINLMYSFNTAPFESYKFVNGVRCWKPVALVLAPTRELALQIYDEAKKFAYRSNLRPFVVYGGTEIKTQMKNLDLSGCHLLVATPGRLIDLHNKEIISFENIKYLVLDEADRMLDMGFEPQIREIVQEKNMPQTRQTLLFSATFPKEIQNLAKDFLNNYLFLTVGRIGSTSINITQSIVWVGDSEKLSYLVNILDSYPQLQTLIFVETRSSCDELEQFLLSKQYSAVCIHGKKSQAERERALKMFRNSQKQILVATAVAARGLDVSNVRIVLNFDVPNDVDDYVHRIGRTGRVGSCGQAISFFNEKNRPIAAKLLSLLKETQQQVPDFLIRMVESGIKKPIHNNTRQLNVQQNSFNDYRSINRQQQMNFNEYQYLQQQFHHQQQQINNYNQQIQADNNYLSSSTNDVSSSEIQSNNVNVNFSYETHLQQQKQESAESGDVN